MECSQQAGGKSPVAASNREAVLQALHKVLDHGNSLSRCSAVKALARVNACDADSQQRLIDRLQDADPDVRMDAAAALGQLRIAAAAAPLLNSLRSDPDGDVRIQAVLALSTIRPGQAVDPLHQCVQADGYPELDYMMDDMEYAVCWEIQEQAVKALGQIGDQRAIALLITLLQEERYADLQESGFSALAQLDDERARAFLLTQLTDGGPRTKRRVAQALVRLRSVAGNDDGLPPEFVQALSHALLDADAAVRISAVRALAGTRNPLVAVSLTMLLTDAEPEVRDAAAATLRAIPSPEISGRLHALLPGADLKLQRTIAGLLGEMGDPESCQPLRELLDLDDPDVVYEAVRALGQIGLPGPEQRIATILGDENAHTTLRTQAAQALGHILGNVERTEPDEVESAAASSRESDAGTGEGQPPEPRQILKICAYDRDARVSFASMAALLQAYPQETGEWLRQLLRELVSNGEKTDAAEVPATAAALPDTGKSPETSTIASITAGLPVEIDVTDEKFIQPEAGEATSTAKIPDETVKMFAIRLLGNLSDPGPNTAPALTEAFGSGSPGLRREALLAMGRLGDQRSLPAIIEGLAATQPELRLAALDAAGSFLSDCSIEEYLATLCVDPDPVIRARSLQLISSASGPASRQCLYNALEDDDPDVCKTVLRALADMPGDDDCHDRIMQLMFRFSGELRTEAAAALQRINGKRGTAELVALLDDPDQEAIQWICIDALAELCDATQTGMTLQ